MNLVCNLFRQIQSPNAEVSDDALTFDVFDVSSQYTPSFYISNPNPIAVSMRKNFHSVLFCFIASGK